MHPKKSLSTVEKLGDVKGAQMFEFIFSRQTTNIQTLANLNDSSVHGGEESALLGNRYLQHVNACQSVSNVAHHF